MSGLRRKIGLRAVLVLGAAFAYGGAQAGEAAKVHEGEGLSGQIMNCHDGDTCRVKVLDRLWMNVRLAGVDAPEVSSRRRGGQAYGIEARGFLNKLVEGKEVTIVQTDLDSYNRPVVELFLGKELVNVKLVEEGYAEAYRGKAKRLDREKYLAAEKKAQAAKVGIWALTGYTSPAIFRKENR